MSRLKKEILSKLKEYAGKMGKDHLGGDDSQSPKRGGLRDFDGYDNVDYNQDMPMDEMQVVNKATGKDITKHVLALLSGKIDKKKFEKLTGLKKESVNEADDHEVGMGLYALKESVRSAKIIYDEIKKRDIQELEGWVQHKLTLASDYINTVAQYMEDLDEYDDKDKE